MKNRLTYISFLLALGLACGKTKIDDVFKSDLKPDNSTINADGTSTDQLSITLNSNASADRRDVVFTTSAGTLGKGPEKKVTVTADFINGELIASTSLKAPMLAGTINVTASPVTTSPNGDYNKTTTITANKVIANSIHLEPSSFGIGSNFATTDTIVGMLTANNHGKVSLNAKVLFEDFLSNGVTRAGGRFRNESNLSDANSQVMTLYSAPALQIGTNIYFKATVYNEDGTLSPYSTTIILTINQ